MIKNILLTFLAFVFVLGCNNESGSVAENKKSASPEKLIQKNETPTENDFGDMLINGSIGDASNLIPYLSGDSASSEVQGNVYATLLRSDKDYNIVPSMAKSWEISEDQLTITFHLADNIKWDDGVKFTADDLLFQYEMMIHPDVPSAYKETFKLIAKATAPDDKTFIVTFKEPFSPALRRIGNMTGLPRHLLKDTKPVDLIKSPLAHKPVGTGPYRLSEWKTQEKISLTASESYFEGGPYIERLLTRIIPDMATQFLELKSGGIDLMGLTPLQYRRQSDTDYFKKHLVKYRYLANSYTYLGFNLKKDLFKDKKVRQAISYAIDKAEIIQGVLLGLGRSATGPIKPKLWAYNANVKKYQYDPQKAKKLLKEAGWVDSDGDSWLDKDGKKFAFTIITNQGNKLRNKTAQIIQQRLKKIGIDVKLAVYEWSAFINNFINKRKFDACLLGWGLGPDPDQYEIWHSSKTGEHEFNFVSYNNKEVDKLLDDARKTFDREKRKEYYYRFQEILAEEQPYIFLYVPESLPVVSNRIRGIKPGIAGIGYNSDKWWVPKKLHRYSITR